jgi:hypothetical protein
VFPPRRDVGYDWALDRAHLWRNGVEHLERSAELRGRAVVDNENEEGKLNWKLIVSPGMERSGMKREAKQSVVARTTRGQLYLPFFLGNILDNGRYVCQDLRGSLPGYGGDSCQGGLFLLALALLYWSDITG